MVIWNDKNYGSCSDYIAHSEKDRSSSYQRSLIDERNDAINASNTGMFSDKAVLIRMFKSGDEQMANLQWKGQQVCPEKAQYGTHYNTGGYGIIVAALFILGDMVGGGVIAMPNALARLGWFGIGVIIVLAVVSGYTSVQLGRCWLILQERWPDVYLKHTQKPYAEMGYRAGGRWMKTLVSFCIDLGIIGIAVVFLLIIGRNVAQLLHSWFPDTNINFCYFVLLISAVLLPITYLGSPKDFWQVSIGAAFTSTIAVIIMLIGIWMQYGSVDYSKARYPIPPFHEMILGYGTIAFAFCGQAAFPTIQHDMRNPQKFPKAIVGSYTTLFLYYLPITILGYAIYGYDAFAKEDSILPLLPQGWIQDTVTILITAHAAFAFIIYVNPVNQELEHLFGVSIDFTWKRIVVRTSTVLSIAFLAASVPAMNLMLDLMGGTFMALSTFVFPSCFYIMLRWNTKTAVSKIDTPIQKWEYPVNGFIILVALLGGVASVYGFVKAITTGNALFKLPCYINGGG